VRVSYVEPTCSAGDVRFPYGKYEGLTIAETYEIDPQYVEWCASLREEEHAEVITDSLLLRISGDAARFLANRAKRSKRR
jgi:hypothetical protein